jgi:hypothetical protein
LKTDVLWHSPPDPQMNLFNNLHADLYVDLFPVSGVKLLFEVSPNSRLYELDWRLSRKWELRLGRIWIPFDDMGPARPFGGLFTRSEFTTHETPAFLPDLWSDLGIAARVILSDDEEESSDAQFYFVNGFQDSGLDPLRQSPSYPSFGPGSSSNSDNNSDKAFGGRVQLTFKKRTTLGLSVYTGLYTSRQFDSARVTALGLHGSWKIGDTWRLRTGYAVMFIGLPSGSATTGFKRAGAHFSLQKEWSDQFRIMAGGSILQPDDRVVDLSDRFLLGLVASYFPLQNIELSGIFSRDMNKTAGKTQFNAFGLRFFMVY